MWNFLIKNKFLQDGPLSRTIYYSINFLSTAENGFKSANRWQEGLRIVWKIDSMEPSEKWQEELTKYTNKRK